MAKHLKTGMKGERLAADFFQKNGYSILHRNWRYRHWEVDLIASKGEELHFIEVKTKHSNRYGYPEETVNEKKLRNLISAAEIYLYKNPRWQRIQFDVLSITLGPPEEYFLIEDIYL